MGVSLDALLAQLDAAFDPASTSAEREALHAAVNGVLGDHLAASANPLAIPMRLRRDGQPLDLTTPALAAAFPQPTGKILVLAHGLCMNDRQWRRNGHDHGAALAADAGFTPVYLHYNSGLHVSTNGRAFAGAARGAAAAPGPCRWTSWSSSGTAWAGCWPAAPATTASLPGTPGPATCARSSSWARRTTARRLSGAATG